MARRLERLEPLGERLLAALAVIDDGFTDDGAQRHSRAPSVSSEALDEAQAAGVLERARGRYRFRHALVREELAARLPEEALRRTHADAAALLAADDAPRSGSPITCSAPAARREPSRCSLEAAEWAAGVGAYRDGAEWAELALEHAPSTSVRACSRCARSCSTGPARPARPAAYAEAIEVAPAERVPALRVQQARACLAAGDIAGRQGRARRGAGRAAGRPR